MAPNRVLNTTVTVRHPDTGNARTYDAGTPEADLEPWAAEGITNPDVWDEEGAAPADLGPVPPTATFGAPWADPNALAPSIVATERGVVTVGGITTTAAPATAESDRDELESMSKDDLRAYAEARGVEVSATDKKADLIDKISAS